MLRVHRAPICQSQAGAKSRVKLVLHLNDFSWPVAPEQLGSTLTGIAQAGESAGFDSIAVMDHLWQHPMMGGPEKPVLECYAALTWIAAQTSRIGLVALATAASYRPAGLLAKMVTSLDVLSGGRAWLGIGAGDYEEEARGLGVPYPSLADRFAILEETIQVCLQMWGGEHGSDQPFTGKHVHLERSLNLPQSLSRPHPPILIAGSGEQRTLRLVARYGDACNIRPGPEIPHKLDVLRRHCETEDRDFDAIERTCPFLFDVGEDGSKAGELVAQLRGLAQMGIQKVFGRVVGDYQIRPIEIMGREVIPAVAGF
jgi:F420-dependent oxidoreductase-like protein